MGSATKRVLVPWERRLLYIVISALWLTGAIWLGLHYLTQEGKFGSPTQVMLLKIHGAAAMIFLLILGIIFQHIPPGWQNRKQRFSGVPLLAICGILILTGWGLYYAGDENFRNWISWAHSVIGCMIPVFILFHVWNVYKRVGLKEK